jgi:hypothetical protein
MNAKRSRDISVSVAIVLAQAGVFIQRHPTSQWSDERSRAQRRTYIAWRATSRSDAGLWNEYFPGGAIQLLTWRPNSSSGPTC